MGAEEDPGIGRSRSPVVKAEDTIEGMPAPITKATSTVWARLAFIRRHPLIPKKIPDGIRSMHHAKNLESITWPDVNGDEYTIQLASPSRLNEVITNLLAKEATKKLTKMKLITDENSTKNLER